MFWATLLTANEPNPVCISLVSLDDPFNKSFCDSAFIQCCDQQSHCTTLDFLAQLILYSFKTRSMGFRKEVVL